MYAVYKCGIDDIGLDHEVVVDELRRVSVVGVDAADPGSREVDLLWRLGGEELTYGVLFGEVELRMCALADRLRRMPRSQQLTHDCAASHPSMTSNVDFPVTLRCGRHGSAYALL